MHDVSWRAHPDYRPEVCFDNATRANLGGLKHSERVFLGLALLHRYSNKREGTRFENLYGLMSHGNPASGRNSGQGDALCRDALAEQGCDLGELRWHPRKRLLELRLSPDEPRPRSLAKWLRRGSCRLPRR